MGYYDIMKGVNIKANQIVLKDVTEDEAEWIYRCYANEDGYCHATGFNAGLDRQEFYEMWRRAILREDEFFLSVYRNDINSVLGFVKGMLIKKRPAMAFISALAIDVNYRRKNIGTQAINTLIGYFKGMGCESVLLTVDGKNNTGLHFWEKNGFISIKTIDKIRQDKSSKMLVYLMKKDI